MQLSPEKIIEMLEESNAALDETYDGFETELEEAMAALDEAYDGFETELEEAITATLEVTNEQ